MEMGLLVLGSQSDRFLMDHDLNIIQHPSPNFGIRHGGISPKIIVLHYTAMQNSNDALNRLTDPKAEVSAHYLIDKFGTILQLVDEENRAWHAGCGSWGEINDINSNSIGIELDHCPSIDNKFNKKQLSSLEVLLFDILKRRPQIVPKFIIGHSDMAPGRKSDPGMNFPWKRFSEKGLSIWPKNILNVQVDWDIFKYNAERFGYRAPTDNTDGWTKVLDVFRLRFLPDKKGDLSQDDMGMIIALAKTWPNKTNNN